MDDFTDAELALINSAIEELGDKAITYHKEYGEVGRITVTPEMFAKV